MRPFNNAHGGVGPPCDVREPVKPGSVRDRRRVEHAVAGHQEPGGVVRSPVDEGGRRRRDQPVPTVAWCDHDCLQRLNGAHERFDVVGVFGVGHHDGRPAVVEDVGDLVAMEPSVDRHDDETGVPHGEHRLEVLGAVGHHDRNPVTGRQAEGDRGVPPRQPGS